jgi:hypothetical protein
MRRLFPFILFLLLLSLRGNAAPLPVGEYIILVGGPSLHQWEKYKSQPHDHWWANFVRAARIRTEQLQTELPRNSKITWLVYKQGYVDRAKQDKQDLISHINSVADKFNFNLIYFDGGRDVLNYLNNGPGRNRLKVSGLEYFGHSNKACFMFDYSSGLDSASKSWFHENDASKLGRNVFAKGAYIRSWGCHTGESMSKKWYTATGTYMWGVIGKTQYMMETLPILSSQNGKWVNGLPTLR